MKLRELLSLSNMQLASLDKTRTLGLLEKAGVYKPINARFVRHALQYGQPSLLSVLQSSEVDEDLAILLLKEALRRSQEDDEARIAKHKRLSDAGFVELSQEERKEILALNVALLQQGNPNE